MVKECLLFLLVVLPFSTHSQSFFDIIPDYGGDEMEGKTFNVIPLQNDIKFIGLIHDSIVPGFERGVWPLFGSLSYDGNISDVSILIDSNYTDAFSYVTRRIVFKNDSICYLYDRRDLNEPLLNSYLIELNLKTGKILKSKIIYNTITEIEHFAPDDVALDINGRIYLINTQVGNFPQILTVLDSNFNVISQSLIHNFGRSNYTRFTEIKENGNIVMVGVSFGKDTPVWYESQLFKHVLDSNFKTIEFKVAPTDLDQSIIWVDAYPVIKAKNDNWIFATQLVKQTDECPDCSIDIPFVVCVSNDFNTVHWERRMFDGNFNASQPEYSVKSICEVDDGYIFAGDSDGISGLEISGLLGKVSHNGDSIWLKHFIPIAWDSTQANYFSWQDIKTTPAGNIVIAGHGSDSYSSRILPWILHLDADGCLEPGCNTVSINDYSRAIGASMTISPNPASDRGFIHVKIENGHFADYTLNVVDLGGRNMFHRRIPGFDAQFMIDSASWPQGEYVIQLVKSSGGMVAKKLVIIR